MKKYIMGLMAALLLIMFGSMPCLAAEKLTYDNFEYTESETGITIEAYFGSEETVDIPSFITSKPVTEIADYAFLLCNTVTTVNVPESVTQIGEKAFSGAANLKHINTVAVSKSEDSTDTTQKEDDKNSSSEQENKGDTPNHPETDTSEENGGIEQAVDDEGQKNTTSSTPEVGIKVDKTNAVITVDKDHHLVIIDEDGNQVVLDDTKNYTIEDENGVNPKIFNEDGAEVTVDGDGNVNIPGVSEESRGDSRWSIWILGIVVIVVLIAAVYFVFRKKRKE